MSTFIRAAVVLMVSHVAGTAFCDEPPAPDAAILERATERLVTPSELPVFEEPAPPTRNFGPTVIERPRVTVNVTADPLFTGVGYGAYPYSGPYGAYYPSYYVPPVYRYGYYYHRPSYYLPYTRYPYYLGSPYYGPYGPPAAYFYRGPILPPFGGAYYW